MTCRVWPLVICHRATSNLLQFQDLSSLPGPKCSLHLPLPSPETHGILLEFATTFHSSTKNHSLSPIMDRWSQKTLKPPGFQTKPYCIQSKTFHAFHCLGRSFPWQAVQNPQLSASPQGPEDFGGFKITHLQFATGGYPPVICDRATEKMPIENRNSWFTILYPLDMVIFHSYVSLPGGNDG